MASGYEQGFSASTSVVRDGTISTGGRKVGRVGRKDRHNNDRSAQGYYKGAEIQNIKSARVYVFGDGDPVVDDENVVFEMPEMRSRLKKSTNFAKPFEEEQPDYFVKEIADGETLQAIALKYACPVAELKRLNKLIQDQEFFALKVLKVPMRKYGILSEEIANEAKGHYQAHSRSTNGASLFTDAEPELYNNYFEESDSHHDFSDPETQIKIMRTLSIRDNLSSQGKDAEQFLKRMDEDLRKFKQSSRRERESLSEVISVLNNKSIHPLQTSRRNDKGVLCGISWFSILVVSLIVAIIVPVIVFVYIRFFSHIHG